MVLLPRTLDSYQSQLLADALAVQGVPMFPLFLSLRNFAVLKRKETVIGVLIAAASWNGEWSRERVAPRSVLTPAVS